MPGQPSSGLGLPSGWDPGELFPPKPGSPLDPEFQASSPWSRPGGQSRFTLTVLAHIKENTSQGSTGSVLSQSQPEAGEGLRSLVKMKRRNKKQVSYFTVDWIQNLFLCPFLRLCEFCECMFEKKQHLCVYDFPGHPILYTIKSIQENISLHLSYPFCLSAYLDFTCVDTLDAMLLAKRN